jgi:hypothetical protein
MHPEDEDTDTSKDMVVERKGRLKLRQCGIDDILADDLL